MRGDVSELSLDLKCLWNNAAGAKECRIRLGQPSLDRDGLTMAGSIEIAGPRTCNIRLFGVDAAQVKHLQVWFVEHECQLDHAQLLDANSHPINLRRLLPLLPEEFDGITKASMHGHPPDTKWAFVRDLQWCDERGGASFRLKISEPVEQNGNPSFRRVAANYPLLGDYVVQDAGEHVLVCALALIAFWNGARIVDRDGRDFELESLSGEIGGRTPSNTKALREMIRAYLGEDLSPKASRSELGPQQTTP